MNTGLRKITQEELNQILEQHKLWFNTDEQEGKRANLSWTDLEGLDLRGADLRYADLTGAILYGAILTNANLTGADFTNIAYSETTANFALACPEKGSFIGFKKANSIFGEEHIVELLIPEDAKRSSATSRKCRCSKAKVLSITNLDGTDADVTKVYSGYDPSFIYKVGEMVGVEDFDEDRWKECTSGIHFFITRDEAVRY